MFGSKKVLIYERDNILKHFIEIDYTSFLELAIFSELILKNYQKEQLLNDKKVS